MVVQHNLTAMNSNRMLGLTTKSQAKSTEKLSSGYKINRAADDAAGLAISEKMRRQVRGLTQASANAQDGISAVQTAEGALTEVHDMLQRMNELATKSANGTNSQEERDYIQSEVDALIDEIDRVSETTKFNEIYLLKGSEDGADAPTTEAVKKTVTMNEETIKAMEGGLKVKDGTSAYAKGGTDAVTGATEDSEASMALNATAIGGGNSLYFSSDGGTSWNEVTTDDGLATYCDLDADTGVVSLKTDIKAYTHTAGTAAPAMGATEVADITTVVTGTAAVEGNGGTLSQYVELVDGQIKYKEGAMLYTQAANTTDQFGDQTEATKIAEENLDDYFDIEGKYIYTSTNETDKLEADADLAAYFDEYGVYTNKLYTKNDDGDITEIGAEQIGNYFDIDDVEEAADSAEVPGALKFDLHVGAEGNNDNKIRVEIKAMSAAGIGIDGLKGNKEGENGSSTNGVSTEDSATHAIDTIKAAIKIVSQQRSDLGAVQNRLEHTINNLDNIVENTSAAESAIRDTDMATEMVRYANNNILAQAGQSMLAQANQANQGVLSLLG